MGPFPSYTNNTSNIVIITHERGNIMSCFTNPDRLGVFATFVSLIASVLAFCAATGILRRIEEGAAAPDEEIIVISQKMKADEIMAIKQKIDQLEKQIERINAHMK